MNVMAFSSILTDNIYYFKNSEWISGVCVKNVCMYRKKYLFQL